MKSVLLSGFILRVGSPDVIVVSILLAWLEANVAANEGVKFAKLVVSV
jgi:hypothetical protein